MTNHAYIYDALRTPRGKGRKDGALHEVKPISLVGGVLQALQSRNDLDTAEVDDILLGCVTPVGEQGCDIAKIGALAAGWDVTVAGAQINRFCGSGLDAVNLAAMKVMSGQEDLIVAGGVESMSRIKMGADGGAMVTDPSTAMAIDFVPQGISADLLASLDGVSREQLDAFALSSHQEAAAATENGYFAKSLVPVVDQNGFVLLDRDETIRGDSSMEKMAGLRPAFADMGAMGFDDLALSKNTHLAAINHVHTAANSSGIVDGAAALLVGSEAKGLELGLTPRGRVVATALTGVDPTEMLTGPAPATRKVLAKAGLSIDDIDLFEVNEAFAAVVLRFQSEMAVASEKINVNGGAIAMGHPLGATGAMIVGTLLDELERRKQRYGLCTLCVAGGMGIATIIERI